MEFLAFDLFQSCLRVVFDPDKCLFVQEIYLNILETIEVTYKVEILLGTDVAIGE